MGVAIGAADFFAGGADGQQAVQGVFYLEKHSGLDVKAKEDEDGAKQKDEANEELADKGEAQGKRPRPPRSKSEGKRASARDAGAGSG